jgi:hypothetical protein
MTTPFERINDNLKLIKKGDEFIFSFGCYDNYRGFLVKKLKYKLVVNVFEKNGRIKRQEIEHFDLDAVRSVGEYTSSNPPQSHIDMMDKDYTEENRATGIVYTQLFEIIETNTPQQKKRKIIKFKEN